MLRLYRVCASSMLVLVSCVNVFVLCCFVERGQPLESVEMTIYYTENTYVQDSYVCVRVL